MSAARSQLDSASPSAPAVTTPNKQRRYKRVIATPTSSAIDHNTVATVDHNTVAILAGSLVQDNAIFASELASDYNAGGGGNNDGGNSDASLSNATAVNKGQYKQLNL